MSAIAAHYLALAERAEPELFTRGEAEWLPRLDAEVDNFRAALDWSLTAPRRPALRLAGLLASSGKSRCVRRGPGLDRGGPARGGRRSVRSKMEPGPAERRRI